MAVLTGDEAELIHAARRHAGEEPGGPPPLARLGLAMVTRDAARRLVAFAFGGSAEPWQALAGEAAGPPRLAPVSRAALLAEIGATLGLDEPLPAAPLRYLGPSAGLWALAGLVDAQRQRGLEALLARRPMPAFAVSADEVELRLIDAATLADPRWLGSLLDILAGPAQAGAADVANGLSALAAAGLVATTEDGRWRPADGAAAALAGLEAPLAGVALSLRRLAGPTLPEGAAAPGQKVIVLIRTLTGLVIVQPASANGEVDLRGLESADLLILLQAALDGASAAPPPTTGRNGAQRFCPACGARVVAGDRFCAACGASVA